ncbi:hypothetical protein COM96_27490 [Bacillus cereus]|uniref:Uncharacterized protein n=1 Tax=Bacillus cereus TaxID=1396 RepID=A0A2A7HPV2_BACCE|nr:hypothetical protein COM96_27490 [Bacillus cereus]
MRHEKLVPQFNICMSLSKGEIKEYPPLGTLQKISMALQVSSHMITRPTNPLYACLIRMFTGLMCNFYITKKKPSPKGDSSSKGKRDNKWQ